MVYLDEEKYAAIPIIISVILYKHNFIDNKIIGAIRNNCTLYKNDKNDTYTVAAFNLLNVLKEKFQKEMEEATMYSADRITNNINTVYQLYHLIKYYKNVKLINIIVSSEKNYTKLFEANNESFISLNYNIEKGMIKYDSYLTNDQIKLFNDLLKEIGVIKTLKNVSSYAIYATDYIYHLENLSEKKQKKYKSILKFNQKILSDKFKKDNTLLILITDY